MININNWKKEILSNNAHENNTLPSWVDLLTNLMLLIKWSDQSKKMHQNSETINFPLRSKLKLQHESTQLFNSILNLSYNFMDDNDWINMIPSISIYTWEIGNKLKTIFSKLGELVSNWKSINYAFSQIWEKIVSLGRPVFMI